MKKSLENDIHQIVIHKLENNKNAWSITQAILPLLPQWIKLGALLPTKETETCSFGCNFKDKDGAVYQGYCQWEDTEISWYSYGHRGYMENITHWMPLPH